MDIGKSVVDNGKTKFVVTWEGVELAAANVAGAIRRRGGISSMAYVARGGKIPCERVAKELGIKKAVSGVKISQYREDTEYPKATELEIPQELEGHDGSGLVFIDDIAGDGTTARLVKKLFPKSLFGACFSWPAALAERQGEQSLIDFIGMPVEKVWVVFPWEPEWEALIRL